eukprot:COSAG01_NODE_1197_length_11296_cov_113.645262_14_plen_143_part_00
MRYSCCMSVCGPLWVDRSWTGLALVIWREQPHTALAALEHFRGLVHLAPLLALSLLVAGEMPLPPRVLGAADSHFTVLFLTIASLISCCQLLGLRMHPVLHCAGLPSTTTRYARVLCRRRYGRRSSSRGARARCTSSSGGRG